MSQSETDKRARLWFYSRSLDAFSSRDFRSSYECKSVNSSVTVSGSNSLLSNTNATKHWALVLDYMSKNPETPNKVNKRILYEATDVGGLLVAWKTEHGEDEEDDWKKMPGFEKEDHGEVFINEQRASQYCEEFNKQNLKYVATKDNCQRFVSEFLANLRIDGVICLPVSIAGAKAWFGSVASTSLQSCTNLGSASFISDYLIKRVGNGTYDWLMKQAIEQISINGFGKISILAESPIKEYMAEEGKQLVLTALGEATENWLNASRGAFTWWNLLQIPVEFIVGKLMKSKGFTDLEAYGGKKMASALTASGVGFVAGGPFGLLGSLAFWIATEIIAMLGMDAINYILVIPFFELSCSRSWLGPNWSKTKLYIPHCVVPSFCF